ncbi:MAG: M20 family metallo-hydrolase [Tidjanibacter sp.]|nr:M20 family metallo-hydrolase [Tidjanibacter sp.]
MKQMTAAEAVDLLKRLIATPSLSGGEEGTAEILTHELEGRGVAVRRHFNNVWALSEGYDATKPTLMLNSHQDTVRPSAHYTRNPFEPTLENGVLYGLGSNDAGASLVSLLVTFCNHADTSALPYNLLLALTAEEENMGERGMRAFLPHLAEQGIGVDMVLVGEPTSMQAAVGERGLVVLDCVARGRSGHAARNEGDNALYKAIADIERLRDYHFEKTSEVLGDIKLTVTQIAAGTQHNMVPDECRFVVDVRTTDAYTNEQVVELLQSVVECEAVPRSTRVRASSISPSHPLVASAVAIGRETFVSPTTSDRAVMQGLPALKMGVGESSRSHTADEFVLTSEIEEGIAIYDKLLEELCNRL